MIRYKYFKVSPGEFEKGRKTRDHFIFNNSSGSLLGKIA